MRQFRAHMWLGLGLGFTHTHARARSPPPHTHTHTGGFKVKGAGHNIQQTFMLPEGTYSIALDFIKLDFWLVLSGGAG